MIERIPFLWPEIVLFAATCVVMVVGLSRKLETRKMSAVIAGIGVAIAGVLASGVADSALGIKSVPTKEAEGQLLLPAMLPYAKTLIAGIGLLLLMLLAGTVDRVEEAAIAAGKRVFDPLRSNRAEFYAFYLFSLTGLMLCAGADDLIWLFLALELTSLPTYIMVTISTGRNRSREAGVKYFFLGALGAAVFLYGFALIYGGTGTTNLNGIAESFRAHGINSIALAGMLLGLIGLGFKIAAVPMHFYTADVYEGAAPQVSAFLAFVPKTAGFIGILLLTATMGWSFVPGHHDPHGGPLHAVATGHQLPEVVRLTLWVVAALTMTVGNVLAILQSSVKRILAYSSIAHSGYMLVGVIAGPGDGSFTQNGLAAVLFYLMAYGLMNLGCFAVLAALERRGGGEEPGEIESVSDLRGLCATHPALGWTMVVCALSLLGFPPLLGFFGKLPLFTAAIGAKEIPLVIVLGINSAIAAFYYLRIAFAPLLEAPDTSAPAPQVTPFRARMAAGVIAAVCVVGLAVGGVWLLSPIMEQTTKAAAYRHTETPEQLGAADAGK
jgi:NADH-quinone oxidoreductase subunit N